MLSSGTPGSCSSVVFLPLECGCNCAKCLRLHCRPCSTGCPQSLEASGQGDSWVLSLGFFYGMYSVTNICDISLPLLTALAVSKEGRPLRGSHSARNDNCSLSSFSFDPAS